jgi:iron complex outermembrane recepter protein
MRIAVWVAIGLWMIGVARADDLLETRKSIQIPPGELRVALQALGEVEGLHVVFLSEDVERRNTSGVSGSLTYPEALQQLLRGTDLTFRFFDAQTVMILPVNAA